MTMNDLSANESFSKRDWAYAGLSHPGGIAVARKQKGDRLVPGSKMILVGDEHALGLGQFLGKLAIDRKVNLRFEWERSQPFENWMTADRVEAILKHRPTVLLMAFGSKLKSPEEMQPKLDELARLAKPVPVLWVLPFEKSDAATALGLALAASKIAQFHSEDIDIHRSQTGAPSARGYAGWAGAVWGWMK
jgi:hypothetical protein